jgi:anthranilate phosphoribosyltransferase
VLGGEPGPRREVVVLNAAATLWAAGVAASLPEARARAEQAIDDGSAAAKLAALVARSNQQDRASTDA